MPFVALLAHLIAALVASAFNPACAPRFLGTALLFGLIQEGVAALTRYRAWGAWRFFVSAAIIGVIIAVVVGFRGRPRALPPVGAGLYIALVDPRPHRVDGRRSRDRRRPASRRRRARSPLIEPARRLGRGPSVAEEGKAQLNWAARVFPARWVSTRGFCDRIPRHLVRTPPRGRFGDRDEPSPSAIPRRRARRRMESRSRSGPARWC